MKARLVSKHIPGSTSKLFNAQKQDFLVNKLCDSLQGQRCNSLEQCSREERFCDFSLKRRFQLFLSGCERYCKVRVDFMVCKDVHFVIEV